MILPTPKTDKRSRIEAGMYYSQIMRLALSKTDATVLPEGRNISRKQPGTTANTAKRTGMVIEGQFQSFRRSDGRTVYIGEDGQYIVK